MKVHNEEAKAELLPSGLWLTGLLCNASDKTLYAIIEEKTSMNDSNGTQFVSQLLFKKELIIREIEESGLKKYDYKNVLSFSMDSEVKVFIDINI